MATIHLEGREIEARPGDTIAAALLRAGVSIFTRSVKYHRARGPFCLLGSCGTCLVRVDGKPDRMACRLLATDGCRIERQNAYPSAEHDALAAVDWLFPKGIDHHEMFTGIPAAVVGPAMQQVARKLAGLGEVPDEAEAPRPAPEIVRTEIAVAGGGPAGVWAAASAAERGAQVALVDLDDEPRGRLHFGWNESPSDSDAAGRVAALRASGGRVLTGIVLGGYSDSGGPFLAIASADRMRKLYYDRLVIATGASPQPGLFGGNDLPGVFSARGLSRLIERHGVLPAKKVVVIGDGREAVLTAERLARAGATAEVIGERAEAPRPNSATANVAYRGGLAPVRARGLGQVRAVWFRPVQGGREIEVECDAVAVAADAAAAHDLPAHFGCRLAFLPGASGFGVVVDADGRTSVAGVFAAGEVTGPMSAEEAARSGECAGRAAVEQRRAVQAQQ